MRTKANQIVRNAPHHIVLGGYCEFYWSGSWLPTGATMDDFEAAARLSLRYRRYQHYLTEIAPGWREVDRVYWMDNSVDVVEECSVHNPPHRRNRMVTAPGGDVCF